MKNIIIAIALILTAFVVEGQNAVVKEGSWYASYATAQTQSSTTAKYVTFVVSTNKPYYYNIVADIDSSGNGTDVTLTIQGSNDGTNYYDVESTTYGVTADTIVNFTNLESYTQTNASHTISQAAYAVRDTIASYTTDTSGTAYTVVYPAQYSVSRIPAVTQTVAAQTVTIQEKRIMWRYLRLKAVSSGSGGCILTSTNIRIAFEQ